RYHHRARGPVLQQFISPLDADALNAVYFRVEEEPFLAEVDGVCLDVSTQRLRVNNQCTDYQQTGQNGLHFSHADSVLVVPGYSRFCSCATHPLQAGLEPNIAKWLLPGILFYPDERIRAKVVLNLTSVTSPGVTPTELTYKCRL